MNANKKKAVVLLAIAGLVLIAAGVVMWFLAGSIWSGVSLVVSGALIGVACFGLSRSLYHCPHCGFLIGHRLWWMGRKGMTVHCPYCHTSISV